MPKESKAPIKDISEMSIYQQSAMIIAEQYLQNIQKDPNYS